MGKPQTSSGRKADQTSLRIGVCHLLQAAGMVRASFKSKSCRAQTMPSTSVRHASAGSKSVLLDLPVPVQLCMCAGERYRNHVQALQTGFGMLDPGDQDSAQLEQDILSTCMCVYICIYVDISITHAYLDGFALLAFTAGCVIPQDKILNADGIEMCIFSKVRYVRSRISGMQIRCWVVPGRAGRVFAGLS